MDSILRLLNVGSRERVTLPLAFWGSLSLILSTITDRRELVCRPIPQFCRNWPTNLSERFLGAGQESKWARLDAKLGREGREEREAKEGEGKVQNRCISITNDYASYPLGGQTTRCPGLSR